MNLTYDAHEQAAVVHHVPSTVGPTALGMLPPSGKGVVMDSLYLCVVVCAACELYVRVRKLSTVCQTHAWEDCIPSIGAIEDRIGDIVSIEAFFGRFQAQMIYSAQEA